MEINKKVNHESIHPSLPENVKRRRQTSKVKIQNRFYNELLKRHRPPKYTPEEGEIITVYKIPRNDDNAGLECNRSDTTPVQSKLDHLRSESARLALHHPSKNSKNFPNMRPKSTDNNNNITKNTDWQITYCPTSSETELCDICGQTFTYKCALKRHLQTKHGNNSYICPECDYQSPRVDNIRRHLRRYHKLTHISALITNLQTTRVPMDANAAPQTTSKKSHWGQSPPEKPKNIIKMRVKSTRAAPEPILKPRRFHTKPVTIPPKRNHHQKEVTPFNTPSTTPIASPTMYVDMDLRDLSWLPTALSPQEEKELSTPILDATPVQDNWNIIDEIGTTEEITFSVQAV